MISNINPEAASVLFGILWNPGQEEGCLCAAAAADPPSPPNSSFSSAPPLLRAASPLSNQFVVTKQMGTSSIACVFAAEAKPGSDPLGSKAGFWMTLSVRGSRSRSGALICFCQCLRAFLSCARLPCTSAALLLRVQTRPGCREAPPPPASVTVWMNCFLCCVCACTCACVCGLYGASPPSSCCLVPSAPP